MKISLITTHDLEENKRIEEEVRALGHEFELVNIKNFSYTIKNGELFVPGISDLETDIAIFRGVFVSLKAISAAADQLKLKRTRIFDNSLLTHQYSINKITDTIKISTRGVLTPNTYYSRKFDEYLQKAAEFNYPIVVKLTRTGKGAGVYKLDSEQELKEFIAKAERNATSGSSYMLQEFIPYVHDLRVLVIGGKMFCMKRIPGEGEFRANFSLGGSVELFELTEEIQDISLKALRAVDMSVGGVDVLITEDGKHYILEVNHTPGMLGMEEATKENITKAYVEHVIEKAS